MQPARGDCHCLQLAAAGRRGVRLTAAVRGRAETGMLTRLLKGVHGAAGAEPEAEGPDTASCQWCQWSADNKSPDLRITAEVPVGHGARGVAAPPAAAAVSRITKTGDSKWCVAARGACALPDSGRCAWVISYSASSSGAEERGQAIGGWRAAGVVTPEFAHFDRRSKDTPSLHQSDSFAGITASDVDHTPASARLESTADPLVLNRYGQVFGHAEEVRVEADRDAHTLTFWRDGVLLGVLKRPLPKGPLYVAACVYLPGSSVSIRRAAVAHAVGEGPEGREALSDATGRPTLPDPAFRWSEEVKSPHIKVSLRIVQTDCSVLYSHAEFAGDTSYCKSVRGAAALPDHGVCSWAVKYRHKGSRPAAQSLGGGRTVGVVTDEYGGAEAMDRSSSRVVAVHLSPFFYGLRDEPSEAWPHPLQPLSSSPPALNTAGRVFGHKEQMRVEVDREERSMTFWRDGVLLGSLARKLPPAGEALYVVASLHPRHSTVTLRQTFRWSPTPSDMLVFARQRLAFSGACQVRRAAQTFDAARPAAVVPPPFPAPPARRRRRARSSPQHSRSCLCYALGRVVLVWIASSRSAREERWTVMSSVRCSSGCII